MDSKPGLFEKDLGDSCAQTQEILPTVTGDRPRYPLARRTGDRQAPAEA